MDAWCKLHGGPRCPINRLAFILQRRETEWAFCIHSVRDTENLWHPNYVCSSVQFSSVAQSCPTLCDPMNRTRQASLSITNSQSSSRLTSIESVMPPSHLILWHPLLLLPSLFLGIRVFLALHIRWPKDWRFSFSISPSNENSGLISFKIGSIFL